MLDSLQSKQPIGGPDSAEVYERRVIVVGESVDPVTISAFDAFKFLRTWIPNSIAILNWHRQAWWNEDLELDRQVGSIVQSVTKGWSRTKGRVTLNVRRQYVTTIFVPPRQSTMPLKAPPMPREVIEPLLSPSRLTARDSRALLRSEGWNCLESRNAQLVFLADFAEIECGITLDTQQLADLFQVTRSRARKLLYKARLIPKLIHFPLTLRLEQEEAACQLIRNAASTRYFVTQRGLLNFIKREFRKALTYSWVRSLSHRKPQAVRQVVIFPQELPRLQIPRRHLNKYITLIQ
jgi:hypothetical protein